jgi:hypothetical protein
MGYEVFYLIRQNILHQLYKIDPDNELFKYPDARVPPSSGFMQLIIYGAQSTEQSNLKDILYDLTTKIYEKTSSETIKEMSLKLSQITLNGMSINGYEKAKDSVILNYLERDILESIKQLTTNN